MTRVLAATPPLKTLGFRALVFRALWFRALGFRALGFRVECFIGEQVEDC